MKKTLTRGEKQLFTLPLLFLGIAGVVWLWQKSLPASDSIFISLPTFTSGMGLSFSPDNQRLAAFYQTPQSKNVVGKVYDVKTSALTCELEMPTGLPMGGNVRTPAWSADGERIVAVYNVYRPISSPQIKKILIWNPRSGALIAEYSYSPTDRELWWREVHFSPDGKTIICGGNPPARFSATTGKRLNKTDWSVSQHPMNAKLNEAAGELAIRNWDGKNFQVLNTRTKRPLWQPEIGTAKIFKWQDGILCVQGDAPEVGMMRQGKDSLWLWDGKKQRQLTSPPVPTDADVEEFALSPDGRTIAYADGKATVRWILSGYSGELVAYDYLANRVLWRYETDEKLTALSWSPDGKRLVALVNNNFNSPYLLFNQSGKLLASGRKNYTYSNIWAPDSQHWASFSSTRENTSRASFGLEIHRFGD